MKWLHRWKNVRGSFTVEAALIVPMVIVIVLMGLQLGMERQKEIMVLACHEPLVSQLDPVEEMYKMPSSGN